MTILSAEMIRLLIAMFASMVFGGIFGTVALVCHRLMRARQKRLILQSKLKDGAVHSTKPKINSRLNGSWSGPSTPPTSKPEMDRLRSTSAPVENVKRVKRTGSDSWFSNPLAGRLQQFSPSVCAKKAPDQTGFQKLQEIRQARRSRTVSFSVVNRLLTDDIKLNDLSHQAKTEHSAELAAHVIAEEVTLDPATPEGQSQEPPESAVSAITKESSHEISGFLGPLQNIRATLEHLDVRDVDRTQVEQLLIDVGNLPQLSAAATEHANNSEVVENAIELIDHMLAAGDELRSMCVANVSTWDPLQSIRNLHKKQANVAPELQFQLHNLLEHAVELESLLEPQGIMRPKYMNLLHNMTGKSSPVRSEMPSESPATPAPYKTPPISSSKRAKRSYLSPYQMEEVPIAEGTDLTEVLKDWQDRLAMKRSSLNASEVSSAGEMERAFIGGFVGKKSPVGSRDEDGSSDDLESILSSDEGSDSKCHLPLDSDKVANQVAQWGHVGVQETHSGQRPSTTINPMATCAGSTPTSPEKTNACPGWTTARPERIPTIIKGTVPQMVDQGEGQLTEASRRMRYNQIR